MLLYFRFYSRACAMLVYLIISTIMLANIWHQRHQIRTHSLITRQLIMLLLAGLLDTIRNIWLIADGELEINKESFTAIKYISNLSEMMFYFQHWEFTVQYLKCAVMFEIPFKQQDDAVIAESKKRKLLLRVTKYSVFTMMIAWTGLVMSPIAIADDAYVQVFWALVTVMMAIMLNLSMNRIDNFRKKLFEE